MKKISLLLLLVFFVPLIHMDYSKSYENNQLNANIKNGLLNICSSIYNSNTTPPENFWEVFKKQASNATSRCRA